jgi:hypothetical protein
MNHKKNNFWSKVGATLAAMTILILFAATPLKASAAEAKREPGKFSGFMFGDYYFASRHHNSAIEGMNGFWIRRTYLTYDQKLDKGFAVRFRLEANSVDGFDPAKSDTLKPFIKDLYGQYSEGLYSVYFGLISTPTWETAENLLGYRPIEKTPLDLYKLGEARDLGISVRGFFTPDKKTAYNLMVGNGSGTKAETDKGKTLYASLSHKIRPQLTVELYGDLWNRSGTGSEDWTTLQGLLAYTMPRAKIGLLYVTQTRSKTGAPDFDIAVTSFYADYRISDRAMPLFRVDFVSDPVPGGDKIAYLPLATNAKPTFYLFGVRYNITDFFYLVPNVEIVKYSEPTTGSAPDDTIFYRLTFYLGWK